MGVRVLRGGEGLVGGRVLLEPAAPGPAAQRLGVEPGVQRRVEVRPAHLPAAAAQRPTCAQRDNIIQMQVLTTIVVSLLKTESLTY